MHLEWTYGKDKTGQGFFCPELPQKRHDYFVLKLLRPAEAEAVYQCRPGSKIGSIFLASEFRYFEPPTGLENGLNYHTVRQWIQMKGGWIAQGWDTSVSASAASDWSVGVTGLLVPCEDFHREHDAQVLTSCDAHYDVYILDVYRRKLEIGDLAVAIRQQAQKWNPEKMIIEKRANGAAVMQALQHFGLPMEGVMPQESKRERAINGGSGAGSAQGWFRAGRVLFPVPDHEKFPWLADFERELKDFSGARAGQDDQVDALVHLLNYSIIEGGMTVNFPSGWTSVDEVDQHMRGREPDYAIRSWTRPVEEMLKEATIIDPFADMCGRCRYFEESQRPNCMKHRFMVSTLHPACEHFDDGSILNSFPRF